MFTISRLFEAPREKVWQAWTENDQLKQWFGPKGMPISTSQLELKPGGVYHYAMKTPVAEMWGKWVYKEIKAPEKLVFMASFSDVNGSITRNPWDSNWPAETLSTVYFNQRGNETEIVMEAEPYNSNDIERQTFTNGHASMKMGWAGTLDQLAEFLAK